jgi:hypothetical protein
VFFLVYGLGGLKCGLKNGRTKDRGIEQRGGMTCGLECLEGKSRRSVLITVR